MSPGQKGEPVKGKKVLLVDDEVDFTASLRKVLSRRGFEVEEASDGLIALTLIAKEPFDVIVLDVKMPGMDGIHVLSEIKRMALEARVILLTGHLSLTDEEKGIKEGAFAYLFKPFPILKLVGVIQAAAEGDKK
ncbi:MAG: response regulator [Desulfobacca sp.]|nr:response regulator [Desulfobacca sp.]